MLKKVMFFFGVKKVRSRSLGEVIEAGWVNSFNFTLDKMKIATLFPVTVGSI